MNSKSYRFLSYKEWESGAKETYPNARADIDRTEVVISVSNGKGTHTKTDAISRISNLWRKEEL